MTRLGWDVTVVTVRGDANVNITEWESLPEGSLNSTRDELFFAELLEMSL